MRILQLLFALWEGAITTLEFVQRVRGVVPDPLGAAGLIGREQQARDLALRA